MPKRRRLLTPMKKKQQQKTTVNNFRDFCVETSTPRGRLKGALLEALEPTEDPDVSVDRTPIKRENSSTVRRVRKYSSDNEKYYPKKRSPHHQSYVLKLFDRSVDLSQFEEDSPLYPICRAWFANQPKIDYRTLGRKKFEEPEHTEESVDLPGPEGPVISRIPETLPEQKTRSKDNINLDYNAVPPLSRETLLQEHIGRWSRVRQAWIDHATKVEARYEATQNVLNKININA